MTRAQGIQMLAMVVAGLALGGMAYQFYRIKKRWDTFRRARWGAWEDRFSPLTRRITGILFYGGAFLLGMMIVFHYFFAVAGH